jgi:hypothetical protein
MIALKDIMNHQMEFAKIAKVIVLLVTLQNVPLVKEIFIYIIKIV